MIDEERQMCIVGSRKELLAKIQNQKKAQHVGNSLDIGDTMYYGNVKHLWQLLERI